MKTTNPMLIKAKSSYVPSVEVLPLGLHIATGVEVGIYLPVCQLAEDYRGEHIHWSMDFRQLTGEVLQYLPKLKSYTSSEDGHTIFFALKDSFELDRFYTDNRNANLWKLCELLRTIHLLISMARFYRMGGAGFTKKLAAFSSTLEDSVQLNKILYESLPSCFRELENLAKEYQLCQN